MMSNTTEELNLNRGKLKMQKITNIKNEKADTGFTQVMAHIFNDNKASLEAKGLYTIIASKINSVEISLQDLVESTNDSKNIVVTALNELCGLGYINKKLIKGL